MRTVKDFVKQLFQEGKSPEYIRAVAQGSKWKDQMEEVNRWIEKGKKIARKKKNRNHDESSNKTSKSRKLRIKRKSG